MLDKTGKLIGRGDIVRIPTQYFLGNRCDYGRVIHIDLETTEIFVELIEIARFSPASLKVENLDKQLDTPPLLGG